MVVPNIGLMHRHAVSDTGGALVPPGAGPAGGAAVRGLRRWQLLVGAV